MLLSLGLILVVGVAMGALCQKIHLPKIIGMLVTGIALGPYVLNVLEPSLLERSAELRQMALIIVLIKAGLSLKLTDLKQIGRPALLMSFLPSLFEIAACTLVAPLLLGCSVLEGAIMGTVLGAVSPAIIASQMSKLTEKGYGKKKYIPQMIVASASLEDIFVIVLFSALMRVPQGDAIQIREYLDIPVSIILGSLLGVLVGWAIASYFKYRHHNKDSLRNTMKMIIVLGFSLLLMAVEEQLDGKVAISGIVAVMSMAITIRVKCHHEMSHKLSEKFEKLWMVAEVILFVLVGAEVDIHCTFATGINTILMLIIVLVIRSQGVVLSLQGTRLHHKERLFCILSSLPKATVQAAIGAIPLAAGMPNGNLILFAAVISIILTAPASTIAIDKTYRRLLTKEEKHEK